MKVLQLCCFTNHWGDSYDVENIDIELGRNVLELPDNYGQKFDFVLGAPPCTQFTKANQHNWEINPALDIEIVEKVLTICKQSGVPFIIENPPGRIQKLVPGISQYRQITLNDIETNKEWVLYSNILLMRPFTKRYGRKTINNLTRKKRLAYPKYFIDYIKSQIQ